MNSTVSEEEARARQERFCEFLRDIKKNEGLSQSRGAIKAGMSPQYFTDIKTGRRVLTELMARRLEAHFPVRAAWLLWGYDKDDLKCCPHCGRAL
jgi:transcriptional regulator with XRE-family HTH domain